MSPQKSAALDVTVHESLADVPADAWNALSTYDSPFTRHAFLRLLETSGCVGDKTGWLPRYLVVRNSGRIVGAMPTYARLDSYGEYIFDWAWARAAEQAGIAYYPKITCAVPFTPATGERLFVHPEADRSRVVATLAGALEALRDATDSSSVHVLFTLAREIEELEAHGFIRRATHQYHWRNDGYATFDDFLSTLRHENRKQIKKERRRVAEAGVTIERISGHEAADADWHTMFTLYRSTTDRKWGSPYLTRQFFEQAKETVGQAALLTFAKRDAKIIAGTLSFAHGGHLYGRYWGALEHVDNLHFELCYYQLIEHAIAHKQTLVEAGAQGDHKLKRGFVPVMVHSAHAVAQKQLRQAIAKACRDEMRALATALPEWTRHAPFRDGAAPQLPSLAGIDTSTMADTSDLRVDAATLHEAGDEPDR